LLLSRAMDGKIDRMNFKLKNNMGKLDSLSPLAVVDRGYAIATKNKRVIKSIADVKKSDKIEIKVSDGIIEAAVTDVKG